MNILHIAYIDNNLFSGVNIAAKAHIQKQQELQNLNVGLLNIADYNICDINNVFIYSSSEMLRCIPVPFCHPDIVIFHELYRIQYLKIYRYLIKEKIPYVIFPHGGLTHEAQKVKHIKKIFANFLLFNEFFKHAAAIQCLSAREAEKSITHIYKFVGTNGVDLPPKHKTLFRTRSLVFVYIGRIDVYIKGIDLLIEAISLNGEMLRKNHCRFDLYGPQSEYDKKIVNRLIEKKGISDLIKLHTEVVGTEKENILLQADCFIQCSRSEGMSMGILEAMSYGIPCVVTRGTGMANFVNENRAGFGCDTNPLKIAEMIRIYIQNIGKASEMSENSRNAIKENFDWCDIVQGEVNAYRTLL